jgi:hypothetical protein
VISVNRGLIRGRNSRPWYNAIGQNSRHIKTMTARKTAFYGVGAALLFAYLAAANMPTQDQPSPERGPRPAATAGSESLAVEVRSQAAKLHARIADAPVPDTNPRNPFSFAPPPRAVPDRLVHAAVVADAAPAMVPPPLPALTLMGVAEETLPAGIRRTAVIGGDGDTIYMVVEGQAVGDRYKVTKIGVDAVELEDLLTKGYRRIALR